MTLLDILILLPIAFFCYRGFINGIVKEVLSIIGIILAVFFTFRFMDAVSKFIAPLFEKGAPYVPFISGLIIFIGTLVIVHSIASLAKKFLETISLNSINRIAGAGFGILKSSIIISAIFIILAGFDVPSKTSRKQSVTYSYIVYLAPWTYDAVASIYPGAEDFAATIKKTLDQYNSINDFPLTDNNRNS